MTCQRLLRFLVMALTIAACSSSARDAGRSEGGASGGATGTAGTGGSAGHGNGGASGADAAQEVGDGAGGPSKDGGGSFPAVQAIFADRCVGCHDPAHPIVPETQTFPALPLTAGAAYAALVGQPAHEICGGILVVAGDPAASYLYHKVADVTPCEGTRMPHPRMIITPPLSDTDIATIAAWIRDGARP